MITTIEKQYRDVSGLVFVFQGEFCQLKTATQSKYSLTSGLEQSREQHCTAREEPDMFFWVFFVEQAYSTVTVVVQRRRQAGLQGEPCGCNAHKEL